MAISTPASPTGTPVASDGTNPLTSLATGSHTPALTNGRLIALAALGVAGSTTFSEGSAITDTYANGSNVGPWTVHAVGSGTNTNSYGLLVASAEVTGAPGAGAVTLRWTGSSTRTVVRVVEIASNDPLEVVQVKVNTGTGTTLTVTLDASPDAASLILGVINSAGDAGVTEGSGFTELIESGSGGGGNSWLQVQHDNGGGDTTCDWSALSTTMNVGIALELAENSGPSAPDAPTIGTVTTTPGAASVPWTDNDDGGSTILNHDLEIERDGLSEGVTSDIGNSSPYAVSGLVNGSDYRFRVRATNAVGDSAFSSWSNEVGPQADPSSGSGGGGGGRRVGSIGRFRPMSRFFGSGGGGGGGGSDLVLPADLIRSSTLLEGFENDSDWTVTAGAAADNTTAGEFSQGTQGIKLSSNGGSSTPSMNRVISATFTDPGQFSLRVYVHDVTGQNITIGLYTDSGMTDGFSWTVAPSVLGRHLIQLRKGDAARAGTATWASTFIRLRVTYAAGASSRSITLDDFRSGVIGQTVYVPTFDDNHNTVDEVAAIFVDKGLAGQATFFVNSDGTTGPGTGGKCSWADLLTLQAAGYTIGSHTDDHGNLNALSQVDAETHILACIEEMVAQGLDLTQARIFAYPFAPLPDAETLAAVRAVSPIGGAWTGVLLARTGTGTVSVAPVWDPMQIPCDLVSSETASQISATLDGAKKDGKQLVTICHSVAAALGGSVDMTTATLEAVLDHCVAQHIPVINFHQYYRLTVLGQSVTIPRQW